jgi:hypothetical protein
MWTALLVSYFPSATEAEIRTTVPLPIGQWARISVVVDGQSNTLSLLVSGSASFSIVVPFSPRPGAAASNGFKDVAVYGSAPWHPAASAYMRNVRVYGSLAWQPSAPLPQARFSVGPFFQNTVADASRENALYSPGSAADGAFYTSDAEATHGHLSLPGMGRGESVLALLHSSGLIGPQGIYKAAKVSRVSVAGQGAVVVSWTVTFTAHVGTDPLVSVAVNDLQALKGHSSLTPPSSVTISQTPANRIGGSLALSVGGFATSTLPFDASAQDVRAALLTLPSVHSVDSGVGDVAVSRYGPDAQGTYGWYVAFTEAAEDQGQQGQGGQGLSGAVNVTSALLTGLRARVEVKVLRQAAYGWGLATNGSSSVDGAVLPSALLLTGSAEAVTTSLASLLYRPPQGWSGAVKLVVRIWAAAAGAGAGGRLGSGGSAAAASNTSVVVLPGTVSPVFTAPTVFWRGAAVRA